MICPACGSENAESAKFCSQCATSLVAQAPAREERKVVTCLFCDLVGFTARAESMDPEDVRRLLQPYHARLRSELERFGGTVEKFIGDAVMAVFGAPTAHEDDPERAVRAALAIRDALAEEGELEVRIGITTGEALIALDARPEAGEGMASGDVVNTAARLQAAAEPGSILVDETTYRATERSVDYGRPQAVAAKGKASTVPSREALRARARVSVERVGGAPLVGRERELTLLRETFSRVTRELEPQLLTLVGVPGIGKSRLVYELFQTLETGEFGLVFWRHGRSLPYGDGVTFWALSEMVKAQAGILESDTAEDVVEKLGQSVRRFVTEPDEASWIERQLQPLTGVETDATWSGDQRSEAFAAWRLFFEALAHARPLVLVFEDLHWADDALLDFVDYLVEWARGVPLLALCTARPELLARRPGWGGGKVNSSTILLSALSEDEMTRLVASLLEDSELAGDSTAQLLEHAAGNPLYAEEFTRLLSTGEARSQLPETVQGIIAARLDTLPREEKDLLQDAAVLGRVFWLGALGRERWTLEERLHSLERKEFVGRERRSTVAGEAEYAFRHALVRDVAYEQIPKAERAEKHRAMAEWIESLGRPDDHAETIAHHYATAFDYARSTGGDVEAYAERAGTALREAGDRALALHAPAAAARLYRRALDLSPDSDPARSRLLLELGRSLHLSEASGEAELLAARDLALAGGDLEGATEAEILVANFYRDSGQRERWAEHANEARMIADKLGPSAVKAHALSTFVGMLTGRGENAQALDVGREALTVADDLDSDELRARALSLIGWARLEADDDGGLSDFERSLELAHSLGSPEAIRTSINFSHHLRHRGEFRRAIELVEDALRLADRFGDVPAGRFLRSVLPQIRYRQGAWDEALELAGVYLDEVQGLHVQLWLALGTRALIRLSREDERGLDDLGVGVAAARRSTELVTLPAALGLHARSLLLAGRRDEAARAWKEALEIFETGVRKSGFDLAHLVVATVGLGEDGERVLAVARRGRWADAARLYLAGEFGRAADVYAEIGSPTDEAEARLSSGRSLLEAGRSAEGEAEVARALEFYRGVDATYFVRQGEALLAPVS